MDGQTIPSKSRNLHFSYGSQGKNIENSGLRPYAKNAPAIEEANYGETPRIAMRKLGGMKF